MARTASPVSGQLGNHGPRSAYATAAVARCSKGDVIILFRRLSWDYKTNLPFRFGQRIILNRLLQVYGRDTA